MAMLHPRLSMLHPHPRLLQMLGHHTALARLACTRVLLCLASVATVARVRSGACWEGGTHALLSSMFGGRYPPTAIKMILAV
jgi:hypothetical protein